MNFTPMISQNDAFMFTQQDRERMVRIETKLEEMEKRMTERFEQSNTYMGWMIALFGSMFLGTIAFAFWDRRTMVKPVEAKVNDIEQEIVKLKDDKNGIKVLAALRDLAKTDVKLAEILKMHNLL